MNKKKIGLLCFGALLIFACDSEADNAKSSQKASSKLLDIFISPEKKQENSEFEQLEKEINNFGFPAVSESNIKNFNLLNNKINNFIKKYSKSKKRLEILAKYKEDLKDYSFVIQKYYELKNSKRSQELEGIMYEWNISESHPRNENVGKIFKKSKNVINQLYQSKAQQFEKERLAIVENINNPKLQNKIAEKEIKINKNVSQNNLYFKSCKEARTKGYAGILKGQPGYSQKLDKDGDGIACE